MKIDVIIISQVYDLFWRLRIDDKPKRVDKEFIYVAELVDTNDSKLRGVTELKLTPDAFNAILRSQITPFPLRFNGRSIVSRLLPCGVDSTIISLGHFVVSEGGVRYMPEYSENAVTIYFIDIDSSKLITYVPDTRAREWCIYILDSDLDRLRRVGGGYTVLKIPTTVYAHGDRMILQPYMIASCDVLKPATWIVSGTLLIEGEVGERTYVRFQPGITKEIYTLIMQGWGILTVTPHVRDEKLKETLSLPAKYWREMYEQAIEQINILRDQAIRLGNEMLRAQIEQILEQLTLIRQQAEKQKLILPYFTQLIETTK